MTSQIQTSGFRGLVTGLVFVLGGGGTGVSTAEPTVSVTGTARQTFQPDVVRVRWRIHASGNSGKSVLKKLDASRRELDRRLAGLDEPKPTSRIGDAADYAPQESQTNMQARLMVAMGQGEKKEEDPRKVQMAFPVTLEWPLPGSTAEQRQRFLDTVKLRLDDMEVLKKGKGPEDDEESGSDDESDDRAAKESGSGDEGDGAKPSLSLRIADGPTFYFVHQVSTAEDSAALKAAFDEARRRAERLAAAADRKLGALLSMNDYTPSNPYEDLMETQTNTMERMFGSGRPTFDDDRNRSPTELISDSLKPLSYVVKFSVTFELQ